jgi:hypothetical protein
MKLRQLFESKAPSVGIIFGRFNPPHQGHVKAWEMASENPAWFVGTNQSTQGPKDPLPYDIKVKAMLAVMPEVKGHIVAETSWLTLASKVYKKYGDTVLNVYTDEDWVTKALVQYNGKDGAHGYYNFSNIEQQPTPRLSSATALRAAVQAGDREAFAQAAGVPSDTPVAGHPFFDVVAHYLAPHAEKEKVKAAKKKVKQPEQDVAENDFKDTLYELSNEFLGRYKKAAAADAKKADAEGDYDRGNKRFSGIVKATKKQFANDEKSVAENKLGEMIPWPVVANKIGSAMKAMGWKAQRKGDDAFMFSTKGAEDESQYYMVMIDNEGDGMFSYALGTFEGGRPDIGEHGKLPTTEASVSEVLMAIRDGYGLNEIVAENAWDRLQREKALESAGVGIITKQNTTVDVNKNTPKKNLKAFRLI